MSPYHFNADCRCGTTLIFIASLLLFQCATSARNQPDGLLVAEPRFRHESSEAQNRGSQAWRWHRQKAAHAEDELDQKQAEKKEEAFEEREEEREIEATGVEPEHKEKKKKKRKMDDMMSDPLKGIEGKALEKFQQAMPKSLPKKQAVAKSDATTAELTGVDVNKPGDLPVKLTSLAINSMVVIICVLIFSWGRLRFPMIYAYNALKGEAPMVPSSRFFGWVTASMMVTTEMAAETTGLDNALLLEFSSFCVKTLSVIGIPMVCILCPAHFFFGGGSALARGDRLSSIEMGNVIDDHPWLYYLHALCVNFVVVIVVKHVFATMTRFLVMREKWLIDMQVPRCTTVLVEGIPPDHRSDAKLREFFGKLFPPEHISACYIVKDAPVLRKHFSARAECRLLLNEATQKLNVTGTRPTMRTLPTMAHPLGQVVDEIEHRDAMFRDILANLTESRHKARADALFIGGKDSCINSGTGFVTFQERREANVASELVYSDIAEEWVVSVPPPARDVLWENLLIDDTSHLMKNIVGYALTGLVYVIFTPLCVSLTNLGYLVNAGPLQSVWEGFVPTMGFQMCMGFLPTIFLVIFRDFFTLKADVYAQYKLQLWYFAFLVFFVILVTCLSKSLVGTFTNVMKEPAMALNLMAEHLPTATHFYMEYLMIQWSSHAIMLVRHVPLFKFLAARKLYNDEDAKKMAEPEDQDFYGIGSRSSRFTINMLIGIIFSTLSPVVPILALMNFMLCRVLYGYLIVFAESKKPDLGGQFFVQKLKHVLVGCIIYSTCMIGVLYLRAATRFPMIATVPSLAYGIVALRHFESHFNWEKLPFRDVCIKKEDMDLVDGGRRYVQQEFLNPDEHKAIKFESAHHTYEQQSHHNTA